MTKGKNLILSIGVYSWALQYQPKLALCSTRVPDFLYALQALHSCYVQSTANVARCLFTPKKLGTWLFIVRGALLLNYSMAVWENLSKSNSL